MHKIEKRIPELKSKLETLSCSSIEITVRKNYTIGKSGSHVIRVSVTDKINGNQSTFFMYFDDDVASFKPTIENQYSYIYEAYYKRNYALEQLIEPILYKWSSSDVACEM